jgi:hypothetical protein
MEPRALWALAVKLTEGLSTADGFAAARKKVVKVANPADERVAPPSPPPPAARVLRRSGGVVVCHVTLNDVPKCSNPNTRSSLVNNLGTLWNIFSLQSFGREGQPLTRSARDGSRRLAAPGYSVIVLPRPVSACVRGRLSSSVERYPNRATFTLGRLLSQQQWEVAVRNACSPRAN